MEIHSALGVVAGALLVFCRSCVGVLASLRYLTSYFLRITRAHRERRRRRSNLILRIIRAVRRYLHTTACRNHLDWFRMPDAVLINIRTNSSWILVESLSVLILADIYPWWRLDYRSSLRWRYRSRLRRHYRRNRFCGRHGRRWHRLGGRRWRNRRNRWRRYWLGDCDKILACFICCGIFWSLYRSRHFRHGRRWRNPCCCSEILTRLFGSDVLGARLQCGGGWLRHGRRRRRLYGGLGARRDRRSSRRCFFGRYRGRQHWRLFWRRNLARGQIRHCH